MNRFLLALAFGLSFVVTAAAADYAGEISAYRRAHRLPAVKSDARLAALALIQARAMAASGSVSHNAGGNFAMRVAPLRKSRAAENIGAGFLSFSEMLKQWEDSTGHRDNLLMAGARRVAWNAVGSHALRPDPRGVPPRRGAGRRARSGDAPPGAANGVSAA